MGLKSGIWVLIICVKYSTIIGHNLRKILLWACALDILRGGVLVWIRVLRNGGYVA